MRIFPPTRSWAKARTVAVGALLALFLPLGGCQPKAHTPRLRIAIVPKMDSNAYWDVLHAGAIQGEREIEQGDSRIELHWQGPANEGDLEEQRRLLTQFAAERFDAIIVSPQDSDLLVSTVEAIARQGIRVISFDSRLNSPAASTYVGTNNYEAGILAADHVAEILRGKGRVLQQRYMTGSESSMEREAGFANRLREKYPQIELLPWRTYCGPDRKQAYQTCQQALTEFGGQAQLVMVSTQFSGTEMLRAMTEARLAGSVPLVVFDTNPLLVSGLKDGTVRSLVVQSEMEIGRKAVEMAYRRILGTETPRSVYTPVAVVTRDNINDPAIHDLIEPPFRQYLPAAGN